MTAFWIVCAALLAIALLFVVLPLWRNSVKNNALVRDATNLAILRHQSAELDLDLKNGLLTQDAYDQGKRELQARLLEEVKTDQPTSLLANPAKALAITLVVIVPVASLMLYQQIGNKEGLAHVVPDRSQQQQAPQQIALTAEDIAKIEQKVQKDPSDPEDWWALANAYTEQEKYKEAAFAYRNLVELVPNEAQLWANYADVYAMANNRDLQGEVTNILKRALSLDPNNLTALALNGNAAMQRGDYVTAVKSWQLVLQQLPPDSPDAQMITQGIEQAHEMLMSGQGGQQLDSLAGQAANTQAAAPANGNHVSGKISLSPSLAAQVNPNDTLFILARQAGGAGGPPLAVMRKQVKDLPMDFRLDDSMAMQPAFRLSAFSDVVVVARVSKSGTPMAQAGDLQGMSATVKPGTDGLNIVIDTVTK